VKKWEGDSFLFEVRNTIEAGDTIEFILPDSAEVKILLKRIIDAKNGNEISKASAGQEYCIRIFANDFDGFEVDFVKKVILQYCVARIAVKPQNSDEKRIIENRKLSFREEICKK
jgi:hypothetical protein